jgi:hypothetical protein
MRKPKIKVRELKPKIKIISEPSINKPDSSLETRIDLEENSPRVTSAPTSSSSSVNPTITQKFQAQERKFEASARREEAEKERFTYQMLNQESRRKYDASIRGGSAVTADQAAASQRIDPSLPQGSAVRGFPDSPQPGDSRDILSQGNVEPGLRRFSPEERDYTTDNSVQKYVAKRRTDL